MNLTDLTLSNLIDFYKSLSDQPGFDLGKFLNIEYVNNTQGDWPCFLLGGENIDEQKMKQIALKMKDSSLPAFWIHRDGPDKKAFDELALKYGIKKVNYWRGMEIERSNLFLKPPPADDIFMDRVSSEQNVKEWLKVVNAELLPGREISSKIFRNKADKMGFDLFRISKGKKTLSTVLFYRKEDLAGIYMVSTAGKYRGKGYASWLLSSGMDYLMDKGVNKFILHSSELGFSVYKGLGFMENSSFGIYRMPGNANNLK
jgi:ribosomal protein S18 acetylase RimI-like enzyme